MRVRSVWLDCWKLCVSHRETELAASLSFSVPVPPFPPASTTPLTPPGFWAFGEVPPRLTSKRVQDSIFFASMMGGPFAFPPNPQTSPKKVGRETTLSVVTAPPSSGEGGKLDRQQQQRTSSKPASVGSNASSC